MERLGIVTACCLLGVIAVGCGEDICVSLEKDLIVLTDRLNQHAETVENKVAVQEYTFDRWAAFNPNPPMKPGETRGASLEQLVGLDRLEKNAVVIHWQDKFTLLQSISTRYKLMELEVFPPPRSCRHTRIEKPSGCGKDERLRPVIESYTATARFELQITRHSKVIGTPKPLPKGPDNTRSYLVANPGRFFGCNLSGPITLEKVYEKLILVTVPRSLPSDSLSPEIHTAIQAFRTESPTVCTEKIAVKLRYDAKTKQWLWPLGNWPLTDSQKERTLEWHETLPSEGREYISRSRLCPPKAK